MIGWPSRRSPLPHSTRCIGMQSKNKNPFFLEFCFCVLDYIPITYSILLCFQCHQQCLHAFCFVSGASLPALNSSVWIFCGTESEPGTRVHRSRSRTPGGTSAGVPHLCLRLLTLPTTELRIPLIIAGEMVFFFSSEECAVTK